MQKQVFSKNTVVLIALVLAVAVLSVIAVLLTKNGSTVEESDSDSTQIKLSDFTAANIISLEYAVGDKSASLVKNGEEWVLKEYPEGLTDEELIYDMLTAVTEISAVRSIDEGEPSNYGLDSPSLLIKLQVKNGREYCYKIGKVNSFNGYTYIDVDGKIYLLSDNLSSHFDKGIKDILMLDDKFPTAITNGTVMSLTVTDSVEKSVTYANCDKMTGFLASLKLSFTFNSLVCIDATEDELTKYGLNKSCKKISIFYNSPSDTEQNLLVDATFTLLVGETSDGMVYYMSNNSSNVYEADAVKAEELIETLISHSEKHEAECVQK